MAITFENKEPLHMVRAKLNAGLQNVEGIVNEITTSTTENMERAEAAADLAVDRADAAFISEQNAKASELSAQGDAALAEQYRDEALDAREGIEEDKADTEADRILAEQARDAALGYRNQAETHKNAAQAAQTGAETAETNAETAQAAAEDAEDGAEAAKVASETARTQAETFKNNAQTSATAAATSASQANASATSASASSLSAATNAANANTYANNAAGSATTANNAATTATTKAGEASTSATNAATSASTATTQAGIATDQATIATNKALEASGYAGSAEDAAIAADASATIATTQASNASTSASDANSFATSASNSAASALSSASAAALSAGSANDAKIAAQDIVDNFAIFRFLGKVEWWPGNPSMIPAGFLPLNGQLLNRADYPDLWEDISNGVFISVTDALWLDAGSGSVGNRGKFSTGDDTTTFRLPDLNGVQSGSLKGLYLRGMGAAGLTPSAGDVLGDAIRNITGFITSRAASTTTWGAVDGSSGVFAGVRGAGLGVTTVALGSTNAQRDAFYFDASTVVPTTDTLTGENRPVSAVGTWIMLVNGAPARQFNPETSAGLGSNTFGGLQKFNAGFEWVGVVPQLIQTDVEQGLTDAQKLRAASNIGAVVYGQAQALTEVQKAQALANLGISYENGSGFYKLPSGRMIQWGSTTGITGANSTIGVVFPLAFPSAPTTVIASNGDWGQAPARPLSPVLVHPASATGASFGWSGLSAGLTVRANWIAIGGWV